MRALLVMAALFGCGGAISGTTGVVAPRPSRAPRARAAGDSGEAPATRAQRLADLFDVARLTGDGAAREQLAGELGLDPESRGVEATRTVLGELIDEARAAGREALADLLDEDLAELDGDDPLPIARHRRELALSLEAAGDPATGNALLALWAACAQPLEDAAVAAPSRRAAIAAHCRHSLPDAAPTWSGWIGGLGELLARAGRASPKISPLLERLAQRQAAFAERVEKDGLEPPDLRRLAPELPDGQGATARGIRAAPWLHVDGDLVVIGRARYTLHDHALGERIAPLLGRDPAHRLLVLLTGASTAEGLDVAGELARAAGKTVLDVALRGADGQPVALPLDLGVGYRRDRPRTVAEVAPSLVLIARPEGPLVRAPTGDLVLPPEGAVWLARAFPDETEVSVALDPSTRIGDLIALLVAAERSFHRLVLLPRIPALPPEGGFAARARRRAAAVVNVTDGNGRPSQDAKAIADAVRGCYLEALDRIPELTLVVKLPSTTATAEGNAALVGCLELRTRSVFRSRALRIDLRPRS